MAMLAMAMSRAGGITSRHSSQPPALTVSLLPLLRYPMSTEEGSPDSPLRDEHPAVPCSQLSDEAQVFVFTATRW